MPIKDQPQSTEIIEVAAADFDQLIALLDDPPAPNASLRELLSTSAKQAPWCGPKYLRGIHEPCDGSCCGLRSDGTVYREQTVRLNKASPDGGDCRIYGDGREIVRGPIS